MVRLDYGCLFVQEVVLVVKYELRPHIRFDECGETTSQCQDTKLISDWAKSLDSPSKAMANKAPGTASISALAVTVSRKRPGTFRRAELHHQC